MRYQNVDEKIPKGPFLMYTPNVGRYESDPTSQVINQIGRTGASAPNRCIEYPIGCIKAAFSFQCKFYILNQYNFYILVE